MSNQRSHSDPQREQLWALVDRLYSGLLTAEERDCLESLIASDEEACRFCAVYANVHAMLRWRFRPLDPKMPASDASTPVEIGTQIEPVAGIILRPAPLGDQPIPGFLGGALHGTIGYFSQGMPLAYLAATVLVGLGLLISSLIPVSSPRQIANSVSPPAPAVVEPKIDYVGRITGIVDCRWAGEKGSRPENPTSRTRHPKSLVAFGDKFAVAAGLLEITYNSGAKVILQGPVTYEVDSRNGGFLSIGKLTGKLGKKNDEFKMMNDELRTHVSDIHPSSFIIHPFSIRTPTATVTDLGTEFGVEVDRSGVTESHVFRGAVRVELNAASLGHQQEGHAVVLRENESVRVEEPNSGGDSPRLTVRHELTKPAQFVRHLPPPKKALRANVLARFRLGEDDLGAVAGQPVGAESISHSRRDHLKTSGSPTYSADTAAPGSSMAVSFSGKDGEYLCCPEFGASSPNFVLEAWIRPTRVVEAPMHIVYNGQYGLNGYGLYLSAGRVCCALGGVHLGLIDSRTPYEAGQWTHLALVCEYGRVQLWVNGQLAHEAPDPLTPIVPGGPLTIGGLANSDDGQSYSFDGQIDEVRLSGLEGPFDPRMLLFSVAASAPSKTEVEQKEP